MAINNNTPDVSDLLASGVTIEQLTENAVIEHDSLANAGRRLLAEILTQMEEAETSSERKRALAKIYDLEPMAKATALFQEDPAEYTNYIRRMGFVDGCTALVKILDKDIQTQAEPEPALPEVSRRPSGSLSEVLDHDLPDVKSPPGWVVESDGIWVDKDEDQVRVTFRPVLVTGVLTSLMDDTQHVCLEWKPSDAADNWSQAIVPRSAVADTRKLITMADVGVNVTSGNVRELAAFLFAQEGHSDLPRAWVTSKLGWQGPGGSYGFLAGDSLLGGNSASITSPSQWKPNSVYLSVEEGFAQLADAFRGRGDLSEWSEAVDPIWDYPKIALALYASLVAPCLGIIPGAPNAILDWSGPTSNGKTTALRVAASVWGSPDSRDGAGLIRSWNTTPSAIERHASFCHCLPVMLDDTKHARSREDVARLVYDIASGIGRGRARPDGMRRTEQWRCVLLSTGEAPMTEFSEDAGARARVLSLRGKPFEGRGDPNMIVAMIDNLLGAHGVAGPMVVKWLMQPGSRKQITTRYAESKDRWVARAKGNNVGSRMGEMLALIELGAFLCEEVLKLPAPRCEPMETAWEAVQAGMVEADKASEALAKVWSWALANQESFYGRQTDRTKNLEIVGKWADSGGWKTLGLRTEPMRQQLTSAGYADWQQIIREWHSRGWLEASKGRSTKSVRMDDGVDRVYAIRREAIDEVVGASDE